MTLLLCSTLVNCGQPRGRGYYLENAETVSVQDTVVDIDELVGVNLFEAVTAHFLPETWATDIDEDLLRVNNSEILQSDLRTGKRRLRSDPHVLTPL